MSKEQSEPFSQRLFAQVQALVDDMNQVLLKDIAGNYFGVPDEILEKLLEGFQKGIDATKEKAKNFIVDGETDSGNLKRSGAFWFEISKQCKQFASNLAEWIANSDPNLKLHVHNLRVWMVTEVLNCFFNCQYQTVSGFKPVLAKTVFDVPILNIESQIEQQTELKEMPLKFSCSLLFELFGYKIEDHFTDEEKEDIDFPGAIANKTRSLARQKANHFHRQHRNDDESKQQELNEIRQQQQVNDIALIDVPLSFTSEFSDPTTAPSSTTDTNSQSEKGQPPN